MEKGLAPIVEEGDFELLKEGKPDFMGVNYYQSTTFEENPLVGGVGAGEMNTTGKKGTSKDTGIPGVFKTTTNPNLERTNWDWTIDPQGLRIALRRITSRYDLPILISENGLGEYDKLEAGDIIDDDYRIDYLRSHVLAIQDAISDGVDVLGYCVWSFTDLLSWLNGFQKRYGFVYVNQHEEGTHDLRRIKKKSFYWYKNVIETGRA
jgi:6-phospho-beta-glucosidase